MRFPTLLTVCLFAIAGTARAAQFTESDWQVAFNNKVTHGKLEVRIATGRIDILTETHAIEVDYARNYRAAVKQALQYAGETKRKPGVALIVDGVKDPLQAVDAARGLCEKAGVTFWLINEYVSVNDLADQKPKTVSPARPLPGSPPERLADQKPKTVSPPNVTQSQEDQSKPQTQVEQAYWLNTKSGVRHNRSCRWFGNTNKGRRCGPNEGRPCKQCGG
jgi:hypothetical protein